MKKLLFTALVLVLAVSLFAEKKNVILMIGDGMGINSVNMCEEYLGVDFPFTKWDTRLFCTTYSASCPEGYDPAKAWLDPEKAIPNFAWLAACTDSAASATALNSGLKTTNGRINFSPDKRQMYIPLGQMAKSMGYAVGSVTSVTWCDATPSAPFGHSAHRGDAVVQKDMLEHPIDVLGGTGSPYYDGFGVKRESIGKQPSYGHFGDAAMFKKLEAGEYGYKLIATNEGIKALAKEKNPQGPYYLCVPATGDLGYMKVPVLSENQYPGVDKDIVTLKDISLAALNVVNQNPKGFYLMIEGGAIDHGNHGNNWEHSVCQMASFAEAIEAVCKWVEENSNWDETLLLVTADHQTGGLINADGTYWVTGNGKGKTPNYKYTTGGHTNLPVPVFVKGNDACKIWEKVKGVDPVLGKYIDNTDIPVFLGAHIGAEMPASTSVAPLIETPVPEAKGITLIDLVKGDEIPIDQVWLFVFDPDRKGVGEKWFENYSVFAEAKPISTAKTWGDNNIKENDAEGWYYKKVIIPKGLAGKKYCYLYVGAADEEAWIYVNGKLALDHSCDGTGRTANEIWEEPFYVDLKKYGAGNEFDVVIRVNNEIGGAGLYKGIKLFPSDKEL